MSASHTKKQRLSDLPAHAFHEQFSRAVILQRQGKLLEAEYLAEALHRSEPKNFDTLHLLGIIALQTHRTERGVDLLNKAIRINPNSAGAFNNLGIGLATLKRLDQAIEAFDRAVEIDSNNAEAYTNRGNALRDLNRPADAKISYDQANRLRQQQRHRSTFERAEALFRHDQLADAESACNEILHENPQHVDALHLLGVIAHHTGRIERGIELLKTAISLQPDFAPLHNSLGSALAAATLAEEALQQFDEAIALKPDYADAYVNRAAFLHQLGRHEDALKDYDAAIGINPLFAKAHNNRGNVLADLHRLQDAVLAYDQAIAAEPRSSEAYTNRGTALKFLGHSERALESYNRALALNPDNADAHLNRGHVLLEAAHFDDALAAYDRALALNPRLAGAWFGRARVYEQANRDDDALNCYDKSLAFNPILAEAWLGRGKMKCRIGNVEDGISDYRRALELGGDPEAIHYEMAKAGAAEMPAAMPAALVVGLFDGYADRFDQDLLQNLHYRVPAEIAATVSARRPSKPANILDLGCGTGLVGTALKPIARTLCGVDLSSRMLARAAQRGIYDTLICGDIVGFLSSTTQRYDIVSAGDVFIYIGDLQPIFRLVRSVLSENGLFVFSVESCETPTFTLQPSGRYAHSRAYLESIGAATGFAVETIYSTSLRRERDHDVIGAIAAFRPV